MTNKNLTINERANMTEQSLKLRLEGGENIDPREEIIVGDDTIDSIFFMEDADRATKYGEHYAILDDYNVVKSVQVVKNGVITETKPYVLLTFVELDSHQKIEKRLYAGMVEGLRRNINKAYAGIAAPMKTSEMLHFMKQNPISIWTRWDPQYNKVEVDFFDRAAWEAQKAEKSKVGAETRKGGNRRTTENKAVK